MDSEWTQGFDAGVAVAKEHEGENSGAVIIAVVCCLLGVFWGYIFGHFVF
jgi:hypothetical protein